MKSLFVVIAITFVAFIPLGCNLSKSVVYSHPCYDVETDTEIFFVGYGTGTHSSISTAQILAHQDAQISIHREVIEYLNGIYGKSKTFEFEMPSTYTICEKIGRTTDGRSVCYCAVKLEKGEINKIIDKIKVSDE